MDNIQRFVASLRNYILVIVLLMQALLVGAWWIASEVFNLETPLLLATVLASAILISIVTARLLRSVITQPIRLISQAVLHISPSTANVPAPEIPANMAGSELVTNLVNHIYQLAHVTSSVGQNTQSKRSDLGSEFVANTLPLPMLVLDKDQNVLFANQMMGDFLQQNPKDIIGQNVYSVMDMAFSSSNTFDAWLNDAKANKPVATGSWERVRLLSSRKAPLRQFDLAAYYNKSNPMGYETLLVLFDRSRSYSQDDQALDFISLAVHELRTPVTVLRGYIEAIEEDLQGQLNQELDGFMHKMKANAQQLSAFINNILNVARIENDQLALKLNEEKWPDILSGVIDDLRLRARVRGIELQATVDDDLPTVGIDRVGMYEVLANLVDNAIKYSGKSKNIAIHSFVGRDGLVATTVQDFGVGIPTGVMPNLFERFYRSHRSRSQVGGTGLGLYLAKTIVEAHGGQIWVQSKEGQGSTFGFSVQPYSRLAQAQKTGNNKEIVRSAHGWIKNHSLYRG